MFILSLVDRAARSNDAGHFLVLRVEAAMVTFYGIQLNRSEWIADYVQNVFWIIKMNIFYFFQIQWTLAMSYNPVQNRGSKWNFLSTFFREWAPVG